MPESAPLVSAVQKILEGLDETVRDGGGHYEEAAARRDAAMLREALAQVGQEEPPRPAAILLVYCDEEESFNWGSAHVHAFEKIHGPGGMLEFSREAGSSGDVYRVHNWTWHPKRAGD